MTGYFLVDSEGISDEWSELPAYPESLGAIRARMPSPLVDSAEWVETYEAGYTLQDAVRWVLGPAGETLTDDEANVIVDRAVLGMTSDQAENFFSSLGKLAQAALPVVGGAVGSLIAPGVGTAIGSALGGAAGNLLGRATTPRPGAQVPFVRPSSLQAAAPRNFPTPALGPSGPQPPAQTGVNQLLSLLNNPQLLAAVTNAALGGAGTPSGSRATFPFGQLMGKLVSAAHEAVAEVEGIPEAVVESEPLQDSAAHARTLVRIVGEATRGRVP